MTGDYRKANLHDPEKRRNGYHDPKVDAYPRWHATDKNPEKSQEEKLDRINDSPGKTHSCVTNKNYRTLFLQKDEVLNSENIKNRSSPERFEQEDNSSVSV